MTTATHPAASSEFLSRLHDGELDAQERRDFEAHLADCTECRESVAAYERSLTAFRAAPVAPVPYDLSARILRKIRAQSPSRRPFGVMFGIDIRWAGVFMAALLVAIIAPALLERKPLRPVSPPPEPELLRAYVVDAPADKRDTDADTAKPKKSTVEPPKAEPPAASESKLRQREEARSNERFASTADPADTLASAAPPQSAAAPEREQAQVAEGSRNAAPPSPAVAKRSAQASEKVGGEAGALAKEEAPAQELRFDVHSLDADGRAPAIVQVPPAERLLPLRGREFVVLVQADGSVRGVLPSSRQDEADRRQKDGAAADAQASDAALFELRFQATGQPRRLLIRVR